MSSSTWKRSGRRAERLRASPWRAVAAGRDAALRPLVDTEDEEAALERLLDEALPAAAARGRAPLHPLLSGPFRAPPLPHGSRFGGRSERGVWYGADAVPTALAEVAYYRLLFLEGTAAALPRLPLRLSVFQALVDASRGADLTRPPFAARRAEISSPEAWAASQALGAELREDGVLACRYFSARDPGGGTALAVFSPEAFARRSPVREQRWAGAVAAEGVELRREDLGAEERLAFPRRVFLVGGRLPAPAA